MNGHALVESLEGLQSEIRLMQERLLLMRSAANSLALLLDRPRPYADAVDLAGYPTVGVPPVPMNPPPTRKQVLGAPAKKVVALPPKARPGVTQQAGVMRAKVLETVLRLGDLPLFKIAQEMGLGNEAARYHLKALCQEGKLRLVSAGDCRSPAVYGPPLVKETKPVRVVAPKVVAPPPAPPELMQGRLVAIEGEATVDTLRRCVASLPERFSRVELLKVAPLHLTSGSRQVEIGHALATLRGLDMIAYSPHNREDGLQEYVRGPKWRGGGK